MGSPGEFHYYLDSPATLQLLVEERGISPSDLDWDRVRRQKTDPLFDAFRVEEFQGRLLFLKHEAMISRFHAMLELACHKSSGAVELATLRQGPELHNLVQAPVIAYKIDPYHPDKKTWQDDDEKELLPHRPDAFFTLRFHDEFDGSRELHYFYEADRKRTTNPKKIWRKFRAHFYYVVKHDLHRQHYKVPRIRAVLFETHDRRWLEHLRAQACHAAVYGDGKPPTQLFWFTTSEIFTKVIEGAKGPPLPRYLHEPECILKPIWRTATEDEKAPLHRLAEG